MKEQRYGRRYDAQFEEQAVQLLLTSGKTLHRIARELGISDRSLNEWKDEHLQKSDGVDRHGRRVTAAAELFIENQQLRRDLERVTTQRDILKKSLDRKST